MLNTLFATGICILALLGACAEYHSYQAMKKYYPNLTYWDYCFLGDKLRITPQGD